MAKVIHTNEDPDLMYASDLVEKLSAADEAAYEAAEHNAAFFYVTDQEGRSPQRVDVTEDTLSDGSKAYTVVITFAH